jgi:hypothetical protein
MTSNPYASCRYPEPRRQRVRIIRRKSESLIPIPETPSAFHPRAQRNAFRRRDARQQSRWFALHDPVPR